MVKKADGALFFVHFDDLRRRDHALQVTDAALVAVFLLLGDLVLVVFAQVAERARRLHIFDELGAKLQTAVLELCLHLVNVDLCQFVIHGVFASFLFCLPSALRVRLLDARDALGVFLAVQNARVI